MRLRVANTPLTPTNSNGFCKRRIVENSGIQRASTTALLYSVVVHVKRKKLRVHCVRHGVSARRRTILDNGFQFGDLGIVGKAREHLVLHIFNTKEQTVILDESGRRVSHDCSHPIYPYNALPPRIARSVNHFLEQHAELPPDLQKVLSAVRGNL